MELLTTRYVNAVAQVLKLYSEKAEIACHSNDRITQKHQKISNTQIPTVIPLIPIMPHYGHTHGLQAISNAKDPG